MIIKGLNRKNEYIKVEIEKNLIKKITKLSSDKLTVNEKYIIPGFIDIHTHGGYGTDFVDNSEKSTRKYLKKVTSEGTTSIVHATITTEYDNLLSSLKTAKHIMDNPKKNEARYLGVNIEGNFLNKAKKGSHKEELLVPLKKHHVDEMSAFGNLKIISAAYENSTNDVIKYISSKGIVPSLAHTIATGKETKKFMESGLKGITHTFNAMPIFNHREDTSIVRALIEDDLYTEIIVDGVHVHPNIVKMLYKVKPINKILIITDSVLAKGMPDGNYKLGELDIYKKNDKIFTKIDGALAGSISNMHMCFKNFIKFTNATLEEASMMTSTNQAKYLKLDNLGEIKEGYLADILILDKDLEIIKTIVNGNTI